MRKALCLIVFAAALAGALGGAGVAVSSASTVYSIEGCIHAKPEPPVIIFYCADNGGYADGLSWTDWGGPSAHATGTLHLKTCDPNCASGPILEYPVEITLYNIQRSSCGAVDGRFYKNVRLSFPAEQPNFFGNPPRHVYCSLLPGDSGRMHVRQCGSQHRHAGAGWFDLVATNIKCPQARHVARHVFRTFDHHFKGWRCQFHNIGIEAARITCARHKGGVRQRVRFVFAA